MRENLRPAPIAVFAYNRPDKLAAMLKSLQSCHGFAESEVIIFIDGPKRDSDRSAVDTVCALLQGLDLPNITWSLRESNYGLRNSIFAGVSEVVRMHGRVIVLEDDLVLSPITLDYFNSALSHYETSQRIWSIAGYAYDAPMLRNSTKAIALPFAHPWGWATWARAWNQFDLDNRPPPRILSSRSFKSAFDMDGLYPFTSQLRNSVEGRVNSWYIHWYYTVFRSGGASIFPPRRVVDNFGLSAGSHGGALNPQDRLLKRPALLKSLPEFCTPQDVDYAALDVLRQCRELRVQRFIARAGSAKRMLKSPR